jgi:hypothetical protein
MWERLLWIPSLSSSVVSKMNDYLQPVKRRANHQRSTGYTNYTEKKARGMSMGNFLTTSITY